MASSCCKVCAAWAVVRVGNDSCGMFERCPNAITAIEDTTSVAESDRLPRTKACCNLSSTGIVAIGRARFVKAISTPLRDPQNVFDFAAGAEGTKEIGLLARPRPRHRLG